MATKATPKDLQQPVVPTTATITIQQFGTYVGSSMDRKGGTRARVVTYKRQIHQRRSGVLTIANSSKHYRFAAQPDIKSAFLLIATIPLQGNRVINILIEAIYQAYLNIIADTQQVGA
jgi:hypothetical protein